MFKTINESAIELAQAILESGDDVHHIIEETGVRYTKYLKFKSSSLAQKVKAAAAQRDGVDVEVDDANMYFKDEAEFNHIWHHYKAKIAPGSVSVETLSSTAPVSESLNGEDGLGHEIGRFTTTHTIQAFNHVCDHYGFTIERNLNGFGPRTYIAKNASGETVGNYMDGLGTFYNEKLVNPVDADLRSGPIKSLDEVAAPGFKVGDAVKTRLMTKGTVLTVTGIDSDGWVSVEDSYGNEETYEAGDLQSVVRPAVDPSKFKISGYKVKVLQQFKQVSRYGDAEYSNMLWLIGGDPQVGGVYLIIGVNPTTRIAIGNVFYSADNDFENFGGRETLFKNMSSAGMSDMVQYFRIWDIKTAMDESIHEAPMDMVQANTVRGRPVNQNSESLDPFDIWFHDVKSNDGLPYNGSNMEAFCRTVWNAAIESGVPSLEEGMVVASPEKMVKLNPSETQLGKGAEALRGVMDMGGFSSSELRKWCAVVYQAMVGGMPTAPKTVDEGVNAIPTTWDESAPQQATVYVFSTNDCDPIVEECNLPPGRHVLVQSQIDEASPGMNYRMREGWFILPATVALYGKKVVDIKTAASEWAPHEETILVCSKEENGRQRTLFLASSGSGLGFKVGETRECFHDQTHASKGMYTVQNIVTFKDGEIVSKANDIGLNVKASVAVFK